MSDKKKLTSIVILAYNNLVHTRACIESIMQHTREPYEIVLVDNGSGDGTADYLNSLKNVRVIRNETNLGFVRGCNQGIKASEGSYILLLNNDTVVAENWLTNLISCIESNPKIGLVGPLSNYVSGAQLIEVNYNDLDEMQQFALRFNHRDPEKYMVVDRLVGFCLLIKKEVIDNIGLLDEQFGTGNYEDDDYCVRARRAGYRLVCARDTFVHHFGVATFLETDGIGGYKRRLAVNESKFLEKWSGLDDISTAKEVGMANAMLVDLKTRVGVSDPVKAFADEFLADEWTKPETFSGEKTLSLCMIVKDEEDNLPRCLKSIEGAVDEIIIVDTGSTDKTVEIAESFGAKVIHHKWNEDFSEARNVSLEHATGDWIIFLDADEELVSEDIPELRKLLEDEVSEGFYINEFSFVGDKAAEDMAINIAFRIFRNKKEYRFSCAIHEQIVAAVQSGNPNIEFSPIRINHYGYLNRAGTDRKKIKRNLDILLEEMKKRPEDSFVHFNLGVEYLRLSRHEKAIEHYQKAFRNVSNLDVAYAPVLVRNICLCLKAMERFEDALEVLKDGKEAYPDFTDLFYLEGLVCLDMKDFSRAIDCFDACLSMGKAGKRHITQSGVEGYKAWHGLGIAYLHSGNEIDSVKAFVRALKDNPRDSISLLQLGMILLPREDLQEARELLERIVDRNSEEILITLFSLFTMEGHHEEALEYLEEAAQKGLSRFQYSFCMGECLLNLKKYEEAAEVLRKVPATSKYYFPALIDIVFCLALQGKPAEALKLLSEIQANEEYRPIASTYQILMEILEKGQTEKKVKGDAKRSVAAAFGWFKKLLELQEFDKFEHSLSLLDVFELPPGEKNLRLGKTYNEVGFVEMAAEEFIKAHNLGAGDCESYTILGKVSVEKGFLEEAKPFFSKALSLDSSRLTLYTSLGRVLIQQQEIPQAISILEEGVRQFPQSELLKVTLDAAQNLSAQ